MSDTYQSSGPNQYLVKLPGVRGPAWMRAWSAEDVITQTKLITGGVAPERIEPWPNLGVSGHSVDAKWHGGCQCSECR